MTNFSLSLNIMNSLLEEIEYRFKENNELSDEDLLALSHFFGDVCEKAFDLIETDTVKRLSLQDSTRFIYQVTGSSNKYYYVFPDINFCQCLAYFRFVLNGRSQITCKHILACRLAEIMNTKFMTEYVVSLKDFTDIQKGIINLQGTL